MYQIFSPDGFSIAPFPFADEKQGRKFFESWKDRYKEQGYYSTFIKGKRIQIPLDQLENYCRFRHVYAYVLYLEPTKVYKP